MQTLPLIRRCNALDAPILALLGARLFTETYGPTHPEPELSRYLARSFSVEGVREAISQNGRVDVSGGGLVRSSDRVCISARVT